MPLIIETPVSSVLSPSARPTAEIGLITVNYNEAAVTAQLLDDLQNQDCSQCRLRVVIADNSTAKDDLTAVRAAFPDRKKFLFLPMPSDLGYFGAAQRAFEQAWPDHPPDWLIVSNADIRLPQEGFFTRLAQIPASAGAVIGPRIISGRTGLDQNPHRRSRPTALRMNLFRLIPRVGFLYWLLRAQTYIRRRLRMNFKQFVSPSVPEPEAIYAPHGSFMIFGREYFERGGNFKAGSFLYSEEIFVAETCRRAGMRVAWIPSLVVHHHEHFTLNVSAQVRKYQIPAADYLYKEFFSPSSASREKE